MPKLSLYSRSTLFIGEPSYFVLCGVEVFGGSSQHPTWPDLTLLHMLTGERGVSCKDACKSETMVCEPAYFKAINNHNVLKEQLNCTATDIVKDRSVTIYNFNP